MTIENFSINVSDAVLADLSRRLDATRWPDKRCPLLIDGNGYYCRWNGYDCRRQAAALNNLPHYRIALDNLRILQATAEPRKIAIGGWTAGFKETYPDPLKRVLYSAGCPDMT